MTDDEDITLNNNKQDSTESAESGESAKRLKTDDSGVYLDTGTSSDEVKTNNNSKASSKSASTSFSRPSNSKVRNYRKQEGGDSDDSSTEETTRAPSEVAEASAESTEQVINIYSFLH